MNEELIDTLRMAIEANSKLTANMNAAIRILDATVTIQPPLTQLVTNLTLAMHEAGLLKGARAKDAASCLRMMSAALDESGGDDALPPGLASKMHSAAQIVGSD